MRRFVEGAEVQHKDFCGVIEMGACDLGRLWVVKRTATHVTLKDTHGDEFRLDLHEARHWEWLAYKPATLITPL